MGKTADWNTGPVDQICCGGRGGDLLRPSSSTRSYPHGEKNALKMTIFWLNKCLDPFKLKNPLSLSLRTCVFMRNASYRIDAQSLSKGREGKIWRRQYNVLQRETNWDLSAFTSAARQFHGSSASVRYQEEKKPETLQELVETTERPQTALTVGQKGQVLGMRAYYFHDIY